MRQQLERKALEGHYDADYSDYIMAHPDPSRPICNGNQLILAMESGYLWDDFISHLCELKGGRGAW